MLVVWVLKAFGKCLCNGSHIYKNAYKVFVLKIVHRGVCGMCFLKVILKMCLCNGSRFYKNAYKKLCLLKSIQMKVLVYKVFLL